MISFAIYVISFAITAHLTESADGTGSEPRLNLPARYFVRLTIISFVPATASRQRR